MVPPVMTHTTLFNTVGVHNGMDTIESILLAVELGLKTIHLRQDGIHK